MPDLSRRDFLKLTTRLLLGASGLIGLGMFARFLGHPLETPAPVEVDLGQVDDFPPGSRTPLPQVPALLVRTEAGFTALSLRCTHLGCTLDAQDEGFACPCHGSLFDEEGRVLRGPAAQALVRLPVTISESGRVILTLEP